MNKLFFTLTIIWLAAFSVKAQNDLYQFSQSTATYSNLSSSQKVNQATWPDDDADFELTLPFPFTIYNESFTKAELNSNSIFAFQSAMDTKVFALLPINVEFGTLDNTTGVYTSTEGTAGSRIFKIEFRSMNIYFGNPTDYTNFQVWLYEGSNDIEIHYGPHNEFDLDNYDSESGPTVGIISIDTITLNLSTSYYLTGSPASPTFQKNVPGNPQDIYLNDHIDENTVYKFSRKNSSTSARSIETGIQTCTVYPNPAKAGTLTVSFANGLTNDETLVLTDITGKTILTQAVPAQTTQAVVNTEGLAPGIYLLKTEGKALQTLQKIIIN